jgi:excisionase family DNA binding protein
MPFHPDKPARTRAAPAAGDETSAEQAVERAGQQLLYTVEEAAELLRVPQSWLRRRAAARAVPVTFLGRHLRFSAANLAAIVAAASHPVGSRRRRGA